MFPRPDNLLDRKRQEMPPHVEAVDLSHGIAVGDVTRESAVVWARTDGAAEIHVEYSTDPTFSRSDRTTPVHTDAESDYTATVRITGLTPGRTYYYRVWGLQGRGAAWLYDAPDDVPTGSFETAPPPDESERVTFVWSGDTYGQGREPPYRVFSQMADLSPDFFHYQGDTIYADSETPAVPDGEPETVDDYRAKYREMRERGENLRDLLETTSVVPIWDDHEVYNDWSGANEELLPKGRQAFFEYWPIDEHPAVTGTEEGRLYRSFRWGADLELFVLDTRQYRDSNSMPDGPDKTMLGSEQKEWLKRSLANTDATFAVVSSTISLASVSSAPGARDSWASGGSDTGFEHELSEIVEHVRNDVDSTVVWLSGDRHFARVLSYDLDHDGTPDMFEALATPIGAFPRDPADYDPDVTFSPTVHYEEGGKYELGEFYNFGHVTVDRSTLTIEIRDKAGDCRCRTRIDADAEDPLTVEAPPKPTDRSGFLDDLLAAIRRLLDRLGH